MKRKLGFVILPTVAFIVVLFNVTPQHMPTYAAPLVALWTTLLVIAAMFASEPKATDLDKHLPPAPAVANPATSWPQEPWKTFYDKATQMHIDTDKGMYQLITVFTGASLLVLSWVVGSSRVQSVTVDEIAVIGSLAVTLVGIATILKHRLRHYNKLREAYLRRLETLSGSTGPHTFIDAVSTRGLSLSFHEAIDSYYFIYAFLWVLLYCWKA